MRLHLAEPEKKVTPPDIALALQHKDEINAGGRRWAALSISQFNLTRNVTLEIGAILSDGTKERAICARSYYLLSDNTVEYRDYALL
jgi:hypothetical protein